MKSSKGEMVDTRDYLIKKGIPQLFEVCHLTFIGTFYSFENIKILIFGRKPSFHFPINIFVYGFLVF